MAALGGRFNRRIYDCRWSLVPLLGELDGRRKPKSNATVSLSFYYRPAHGTRISTDRSAGGGLVPAREIAAGCLRKRPAS